MRKLLIGSAAIAAAMIATPAPAQFYIGIGHSPYSYGYSPYSYGYSPYSYGYSAYSTGYSPYSYGYSPYGYSYAGYAARRCLRRHHHDGMLYYTRVC